MSVAELSSVFTPAKAVAAAAAAGAAVGISVITDMSTHIDLRSFSSNHTTGHFWKDRATYTMEASIFRDLSI